MGGARVRLVTVVEVVVFIAGALAVAGTLGSAIKTVILPRAAPSRITRRVFRAVRAVFEVIAGPRARFERRDRVLALFAPVGLLVLVLTWMTLITLGYWGMFWANGLRPAGRALALSGSSITTLGFERSEDLPNTMLSVTEASLGLLILALLITFLPTLYGTFSRREQFVAFMEVRAGSPPSAVELLVRFHRIGEPVERLNDLWMRAETWFVDLEETHTSFPTLVFFRSPQPQHSWITTAGAVLDAASLVASSMPVARTPETDLSIRAGYIALRRIASFFRIPFDPDPAPDDPISIDRSEYDAAIEELAAAGIPVVEDREQGWRDFAGWRVNYDAVLLGIAMLVSAPPAPWSSDRGIAGFRSGLALTRRRANRGA